MTGVIVMLGGAHRDKEEEDGAWGRAADGGGAKAARGIGAGPERCVVRAFGGEEDGRRERRG